MNTGTMSKRINPRPWHVGEDDVGRPMLQWETNATNVAEEFADEQDDPLAQTYNFLQRLELPDLALENEDDGNHDPYDSDG